MGWDREETFAMATQHDHEHQGVDFVGTLSGGTAGAPTGVGIGPVVGGPVGASIGNVSDAAAGAAIDPENELHHAYEAHEPAFRREFESSPAATSLAWEEASRAYRYGWESHDRPEYRGKSWGQVCSDLKKGWTGGKWSDYEFLVRSAWEHRASNHSHAVMPGFDRFHRSRPVDFSEESSPAFRFGQALATDPGHALDDWKAVAPEARKYWEAMNQGTWNEHRDAVHNAWNKARGRA
jgi:hypothetical protein